MDIRIFLDSYGYFGVLCSVKEMFVYIYVHRTAVATTRSEGRADRGTARPCRCHAVMSVRVTLCIEFLDSAID